MQSSSKLTALLFTICALGSSARAAEFDVTTATIQDINAAFDEGSLTSEKLVQMYLDRIAAYDQT